MVGVVDQSVEDALGEDGVGEERVPVLGSAVGYDDQGVAALADELPEVFGLLLVEGAHAEVVGDDQVGLQVAAQAAFRGAVGVPTAEVAEQAVGLGVEDGVSLLAGGVAQGLGNMGLALM